MTKFIYQCEGVFFETREDIVKLAKRNPSAFITYTHVTLNEVKIDDEGNLYINYSIDVDDEADFSEETFEIDTHTMLSMI